MSRRPRRPEPGWLFPMGRGFFTQTRWWFAHCCGWTGIERTMAARNFQRRTGALMNQERRHG